MQCDQHCIKMILECAQMMTTAMRRHGATDEQIPLTKSGTPYKSTHKNHPCTLWAGDSRMNFIWLSRHAKALCKEYTKRYGKHHACEAPIAQLSALYHMIEDSPLTPFAQAMPDEYRDVDPVTAYRAYYHNKTFAKWDKGTPAPDWWRNKEVIA